MQHREPDGVAGARRLQTMLRHSTHLLFGLLWLLALVETLHGAETRATAVVLGVVEGFLYAVGLVFSERHRSPAPASSRGGSRWQPVGVLWLGLLVAVWAVLCAVSVHWLWLAFPLYFLVFFIVTGWQRWVVVALMAGWSTASGWVRPDPRGVPQVVGSLIGALVAVIGWIVVEQLRANVRQQQQLVAQVRSAQQQLLLATGQQARAQERERISRDLHDTLAQGLNSIIMLSRTSAARHPALAGELAVIETTARDNLAHARAMMHTLTADPTSDTGPSDTGADGAHDGPGIGDGGLGAVLRQVTDAAQTRERVIGSGLALAFDEEGHPHPVDADLQHGLVMAARSLIANVVQHAHAQRCQVTLTWQADHVALDVVDDGIGFDPVAASGFGLEALRARLHELDATLEVSSEPGQGCSVAIAAPLRTSPSAVRSSS